ncbi:AraC family transcriptional regulator [Myxococcus sp. SDU36]|uniref:helix-turn-helix transcriptional regulator n=1 Tax=Myxococcus sp. SDU36 TaxID=2831967 RepID=UPI0025433EB0|nr:AraC family transcriptional regulator [Myxococcus sp. SDU36]WIG92954.1 AraC family transcriptional regulator [Myxococcus sp. SDU36]
MGVDQGTMTSPSLNALLKAAVARTYPEIPTEGRDKVTVLQAVMDAHGWRPVLELGRELRALASHPVLRALVAGPTPRHAVERWTTLERFLHSRHRTQLLSHDLARAQMTLRHVAIDGGAILTVNDLFIWGVLVALLETAGVTELSVTLDSGGEAPMVIHGPARVDDTRSLPATTNVATFHWRPGKPLHLQVPAAPPEAAPREVRERLEQVMRDDLLHPWTLEETAQRLALSRRGLQRALQQEGTTFSQTLQRVRVGAAHALLADARLTLTDVAFCTGFSDQAHFSRTFRKHNDVPPSALRELVLTRSVTASRSNKSPG